MTKRFEEIFFLRSNPLRNGIDYIVTNAFHFFYYHSAQSFQRNTYLGYPIMQSPMDLQVYQEVIYRTRPTFIVQSGVFLGGSVLFFATLLDLVGSPPENLVVGVDINLTESAKSINHPRVRMLEGNSTDPGIVRRIADLVPGSGGMVVLDSNHTKNHVTAELNLYQRFVSKGKYLVVEDTNINGHPVKPFWGPGPHEATQEFLKKNTDFVHDDACCSHTRFTFHSWLRRER